jgi:hypothetical protein
MRGEVHISVIQHNGSALWRHVDWRRLAFHQQPHPERPIQACPRQADPQFAEVAGLKISFPAVRLPLTKSMESFHGASAKLSRMFLLLFK